MIQSHISRISTSQTNLCGPDPLATNLILFYEKVGLYKSDICVSRMILSYIASCTSDFDFDVNGSDQNVQNDTCYVSEPELQRGGQGGKLPQSLKGPHNTKPAVLFQC